MTLKNKHGSKTGVQRVKPSGLSVIEDFIWESNAIESEYSHLAFRDAMRAWKYTERLKQIKLGNVKEIHRILMTRLRPDIAGKWRTCDVWIGGKLKNFRSVELIIHMVINFCVSLSKVNHKEKPDEWAKHMHVLFENIHPFEDGNGRVGRILWQWHRLNMNLPIEIIHTGKEQTKYYKWFKNSPKKDKAYVTKPLLLGGEPRR